MKKASSSNNVCLLTLIWKGGVNDAMIEMLMINE
jgi:hypothetical protein